VIDSIAASDMIVSMEKIYSSTDVAQAIGCARVTVNHCAAKHGIGTHIGKVHVFDQADIDKIRALVSGNPGAREKPDSKYHGWRKRFPNRVKVAPVEAESEQPAAPAKE